MCITLVATPDTEPRTEKHGIRIHLRRVAVHRSRRVAGCGPCGRIGSPDAAAGGAGVGAGQRTRWFDFVAYGYFASIIAKVFFPADSHLSLMLTYASFAVGFVVRPIGGIVIGAYADRYGRRAALSLLIVMMAFGTLTLGLTPAFATIGIAAPLIVVLGRVVQGISIGGEFASATALLVEYAPANRRMTFGSFQMSSQALGRVLATAVGLGVLLTFRPSRYKPARGESRS